jgi:hypothetical protein
MKKIKLLVGLLVALVFLVAVSAPAFSAQGTFLDGVWLKCKINVKGYTHDPITGDYFKANRSLPVYLHFAWNVTNSNYDVEVWTNPGTGWANTYTTSQAPVLPGENFFSDFGLRFVVEGTNYIDTYHTPFIKYSGNNSKVTYKGTGEAYDGSVGGGTQNYYGYFNISGTSVDPAKLPFDPNLID